MRFPRLALAVACAIPVLVPAVASACGGALAVESSERLARRRAETPASPESVSADLLTAQAMLDRGQFSQATALVLSAVPHLRVYDGRFAGPTTARALRMYAIGTLRSGRGRDAGFALTTLRGLAARTPDDPIARTDLGEALSAIPIYEDEGREILEALAREDLVVHAAGFAALARQRAAAGELAGATAAVARCLAMAASPDECPRELASPPST